MTYIMIIWTHALCKKLYIKQYKKYYLQYHIYHGDSFVNRHEPHTQVCDHKCPHRWESLVYKVVYKKSFHMDKSGSLSMGMDHTNQNDKLFHTCDYHSWELLHISVTTEKCYQGQSLLYIKLIKS
jgi:hypothetical protein